MAQMVSALASAPTHAPALPPAPAPTLPPAPALPPATDPNTATLMAQMVAAMTASKLRAMVTAAIDAKLTQDRDGGSGKPCGACFDCGSLDHFRGSPDCTNPKPRGPPTTTGARKSRHGLSEVVLAQAKAKSKTELLTMPARENIPDNAKYCISIDNKPVGKYCRKCGRFTYGASQHYTKEHKGTSTFPYKEFPLLPLLP
jgi:hypothetical protein